MRVNIEVVHDDDRRVEESIYISKEQFTKIVEEGDPDTTAEIWSKIYEVLVK